MVRKNPEIVTLFFLLLVTSALCVVCVPGCTDLSELRDSIGRGSVLVNDLEQRATTMPANDPERQLIEKNADDVKAWLARANATLTAIESGDPAAIAGAAQSTGIPYAGSVAMIGLFIWREIQAAKVRKDNALAQKTLAQVATALKSQSSVTESMAFRDAIAKSLDTEPQQLLSAKMAL